MNDTAPQRILVGSDNSERAEHALARAVELARRHGARIRLVHVVREELPDRSVLDLILQTPRDALLKAAMQHAGATLAREAARYPDVPIDTRVVSGRAFHELNRLADEFDADLVVLGAHGHHFRAEVLIGTTAERVIRKGHRSVLVVRAPVAGPYRRALAAIDFSTGADRALAAAQALLPTAELHLGHVHDAWYLDHYGLAAEHQVAVARQVAAVRQALAGELARVAAAHGLPGPDARCHVRLGYPGSDLPRMAAEIGADLTVVGRRGQTELAEILLGGVSAHVLRESAGDVLVVR